MMLLTYSPQRKHRRFSLLLDFRLHSSRSGRFRKNPLPSLKVAADFNVASLGVSVLPLHASLSTCNWDMPLSASRLAGTQRHSQPLTEDFIEGISIMPFSGLIQWILFGSRMPRTNIIVSQSVGRNYFLPFS